MISQKVESRIASSETASQPLQGHRLFKVIFVNSAQSMKVRSSVKKMCRDCRTIRREGRVHVVCKIAKHKQRQG